MKNLTLILLFGLAVGTAAKADDTVSSTAPLATFRLNKKSLESACLPRLSEPNSIISRYDIKMVNWYSGETTKPYLGAIVREAERLYGKTFYPFNHIAVEFDSSFRIAGQQVYDPNLRRAKVIIAESENLPLLAHELGHIIGNAGRPGGGIWYQAYNAAVATPCHHTQYSASGWDKGRRNEEFAEVFAAYLTVPKMLKDGSLRCRQAFDFMRKKLFTAADPQCLPKVNVVPLPRPRPANAPAAVPAPAPAPTTPAPTVTQPVPPPAVTQPVPTPQPAATPVANADAKPVVTP